MVRVSLAVGICAAAAQTARASELAIGSWSGSDDGLDTLSSDCSVDTWNSFPSMQISVYRGDEVVLHAGNYTFSLKDDAYCRHVPIPKETDWIAINCPSTPRGCGYRVATECAGSQLTYVLPRAEHLRLRVGTQEYSSFYEFQAASAEAPGTTATLWVRPACVRAGAPVFVHDIAPDTPSVRFALVPRDADMALERGPRKPTASCARSNALPVRLVVAAGCGAGVLQAREEDGADVWAAVDPVVLNGRWLSFSSGQWFGPHAALGPQLLSLGQTDTSASYCVNGSNVTADAFMQSFFDSAKLDRLLYVPARAAPDNARTLVVGAAGARCRKLVGTTVARLYVSLPAGACSAAATSSETLTAAAYVASLQGSKAPGSASAARTAETTSGCLPAASRHILDQNLVQSGPEDSLSSHCHHGWHRLNVSGSTLAIPSVDFVRDVCCGQTSRSTCCVGRVVTPLQRLRSRMNETRVQSDPCRAAPSPVPASLSTGINEPIRLARVVAAEFDGLIGPERAHACEARWLPALAEARGCELRRVVEECASHVAHGTVSQHDRCESCPYNACAGNLSAEFCVVAMGPAQQTAHFWRCVVLESAAAPAARHGLASMAHNATSGAIPAWEYLVSITELDAWFRVAVPTNKLTALLFENKPASTNASEGGGSSAVGCAATRHASMCAAVTQWSTFVDWTLGTQDLFQCPQTRYFCDVQLAAGLATAANASDPVTLQAVRAYVRTRLQRGGVTVTRDACDPAWRSRPFPHGVAQVCEVVDADGAAVDEVTCLAIAQREPLVRWLPADNPLCKSPTWDCEGQLGDALPLTQPVTAGECETCDGLFRLASPAPKPPSLQHSDTNTATAPWTDVREAAEATCTARQDALAASVLSCASQQLASSYQWMFSCSPDNSARGNLARLVRGLPELRASATPAGTGAFSIELPTGAPLRVYDGLTLGRACGPSCAQPLAVQGRTLRPQSMQLRLAAGETLAPSDYTWRSDSFAGLSAVPEAGLTVTQTVLPPVHPGLALWSAHWERSDIDTMVLREEVHLAQGTASQWTEELAASSAAYGAALVEVSADAVARARSQSDGAGDLDAGVDSTAESSAAPALAVLVCLCVLAFCYTKLFRRTVRRMCAGCVKKCIPQRPSKANEAGRRARVPQVMVKSHVGDQLSRFPAREKAPRVSQSTVFLGAWPPRAS